MPHLNSLLLVEEKILESEYFARRLRMLIREEFQYELNAFLSAARSVTFLLQKEMQKVQGFRKWWAERQEKMKMDAGMRFFLNLRNFSQKEGRISMVGVPSKDFSSWSYRFAGNEQSVPRYCRHELSHHSMRHRM